MRPSLVTIEHVEALSAGGDWRTYSSVELVACFNDAEGRAWRATHVVLAAEHWEPSVQRAADAAAERYGVEVMDLRD